MTTKRRQSVTIFAFHKEKTPKKMLKVTCGQDYPAVGPTIQFLSKINLSFVNQSNGKVGTY